MSKAILVMDMPKNCQSCKLKSTVRGIKNVTHCCNLAEGMITLDKGFEDRLPNCPLKTMPEYKEENHTSDYLDVKNEGFNACLDEILDS